MVAGYIGKLQVFGYEVKVNRTRLMNRNQNRKCKHRINRKHKRILYLNH